MYRCNRCMSQFEDEPASIEVPTWDSDTGKERKLCQHCVEAETAILQQLEEGLKR